MEGWNLWHKITNPSNIQILRYAVLYTPTVCPTDSDGLWSDPAISDGPSGQSVGSPSESIGLDWILLLVQTKSSESLLKPLRARNRWTGRNSVSVESPLEVHWTSGGHSRHPLDFQWTVDKNTIKSSGFLWTSLYLRYCVT